MVKKWIKEQKLKSKTVPELEQRVRELKDAMFTQRFQLSTGKLENYAVFGQTRRRLAAVLTLINQKQKAEQANQHAEVKG
jgi:ribosomal protein L29